MNREYGSVLSVEKAHNKMATFSEVRKAKKRAVVAEATARKEFEVAENELCKLKIRDEGWNAALEKRNSAQVAFLKASDAMWNAVAAYKQARIAKLAEDPVRNAGKLAHLRKMAHYGRLEAASLGLMVDHYYKVEEQMAPSQLPDGSSPDDF